MSATSDTVPHNLDALLTGAGEFSFSPGATSEAGAILIGYIDFGNIVATGIKPQIETVEHVGTYRGVRRTDKRIAIKGTMEYSIQCDELDVTKLKIALGGSDGTDFTQSAHSAATGTTLAFATTAAVIGRWYPLRVSGVRVREVTTVTISGKTEGTDFVVDQKTGRIRFLTAQSSDLVPVITASAVTSGSTNSLQAITPLEDLIQDGYGELSIFMGGETQPLKYTHTGFSCQVMLDSMDDATGTDIIKCTLKVLVTDTVGTAYCSEAE